MGYGSGKNTFHFGADSDHRADPPFFFHVLQRCKIDFLENNSWIFRGRIFMSV